MHSHDWTQTRNQKNMMMKEQPLSLHSPHKIFSLSFGFLILRREKQKASKQKSKTNDKGFLFGNFSIYPNTMYENLKFYETFWIAWFEYTCCKWFTPFIGFPIREGEAEIEPPFIQKMFVRTFIRKEKVNTWSIFLPF